MNIQEILIIVAPVIANTIVSIVIPSSIKKFCTKKLQSKIEEVNSGSEFKQVKKELREIKKEILEMRGKIK